jgi:hypothetical protein
MTVPSKALLSIPKCERNVMVNPQCCIITKPTKVFHEEKGNKSTQQQISTIKMF